MYTTVGSATHSPLSDAKIRAIPIGHAPATTAPETHTPTTSASAAASSTTHVKRSDAAITTATRRVTPTTYNTTIVALTNTGAGMINLMQSAILDRSISQVLILSMPNNNLNFYSSIRSNE